MPGNDQPKSRPDRSGAARGPALPQLSRRSVLGTAGVGAAGLAAGAFGGLAAAQAATGTPTAGKPDTGRAGQGGHDERPGTGEPVVVHVRGGRSGELDLYFGTSHTRVHDPGLAARLRNAAR